MVANDLKELVAPHESEPATDDVLPRTSEAAPQAHQIERGTAGTTAKRDQPEETAEAPFTQFSAQAGSNVP
jgi:hypothetical protein